MFHPMTTGSLTTSVVWLRVSASGLRRKLWLLKREFRLALFTGVERSGLCLSGLPQIRFYGFDRPMESVALGTTTLHQSMSGSR